MGLLDNDNEFIDAIKEDEQWAFGTYLRKFFVSMLLCYYLSDPDNVWQKSAVLLCKGTYYIPHNNQDTTGLFTLENPM